MILLTGATGFTGRRVAADLQRRGLPFSCYVRNLEKARAVLPVGVPLEFGDLADHARFRAALQRVDTLINVASMGFGHGPGVVADAEAAQVRRAVFVSTTAVFTSLPAQTKAIRLEAEEAVTNSRLQWTILRPTMVYGRDGDRNIERLVHYLRRWPIAIVAGSGHHLMQPIHVDDLAWAICEVTTRPITVGKAYNLPGRDPLTYVELVRTVARHINRPVLLLHVPIQAALGAIRAANAVGVRIFTPEQIERLNEDKDFDWAPARQDFGFNPRTLVAGLVTYGRTGS